MRGTARALGALLLTVCCSARVHSQEAQRRLYTSDDGLPESWVSRVVRGPSGRIWTSHGIVDVGVFDGYTIRRLPGTSGDLDMSEAPDGTLWAVLCRGNACCATALSCGLATALTFGYKYAIDWCVA